MKKLIITTLSICVIIFGAAFAGAVSDGTIDINLSGTKEISPNAFQMSFTVETTNQDSQVAVKENKENSENLYNALKSAINTGRGDYIKTSNYSVRPNYEYSSKGKRTLKGYTVTNSVIVFVKDTASVAKFINIASTKGITEVTNLTFKATEYENECNALLAELAKKANKRANSALKPLGMQTIALKMMSTNCSDSTVRPYVNYAMKSNSRLMSTGAEATTEDSAPIEVGKTVLNANINASFYVGKTK